jgi:hypothetical protein
VYSNQALERDLDFREARPGWRALLQIDDPSFALLRRGSPCDQRMRSEPAWKVAYDDPVCSLFVRLSSPLGARISRGPIPDFPSDGAGTWLPSHGHGYEETMKIGFDPRAPSLP